MKHSTVLSSTSHTTRENHLTHINIYIHTAVVLDGIVQEKQHAPRRQRDDKHG